MPSNSPANSTSDNLIIHHTGRDKQTPAGACYVTAITALKVLQDGEKPNVTLYQETFDILDADGKSVCITLIDLGKDKEVMQRFQMRVGDSYIIDLGFSNVINFECFQKILKRESISYEDTFNRSHFNRVLKTIKDVLSSYNILIQNVRGVGYKIMTRYEIQARENKRDENSHNLVPDFQKTYQVVDADGKEVSITFIDYGRNVPILQQRYKIKLDDNDPQFLGRYQSLFIYSLKKILGGESIYYTQDIFQNGGMMSNNFSFRIIKPLSKILSSFNLTIGLIKGEGYKIITHTEIEAMRDLKNKNTLSKKLSEMGMDVILVSNEKQRISKVTVEFLFGGSDLKIEFTKEQYIVLKVLIESFGTKNDVVNWKNMRVEKNKKVAELNDIFIANNIPLWINELFAERNSIKGKIVVRLGEYRLTQKEL